MVQPSARPDGSGNARVVLVVDDDPKTIEHLSLFLRDAGFELRVAHDGAAALAIARAQSIDLVLLDLMLPQIDGFDVCRALRADGDVPIILLTARGMEADKLRALADGADDYITKPYSGKEVVARVRAVLRRTNASHGALAGRVFESHGLRLDLERHAIVVHGRPVELTGTEYKLLACLARNAGIALPRAELIERVLGWDYEGFERTIDVHVMNLRKKLAAAGLADCVRTVVGIGYKFEPDPGR
jgi:DNA-binding response OmpR family regulator